MSSWERASSPRASARPRTRTSERSSTLREDDVVLSEKLTGIPVSVLNTAYIQRMGLKASPLARRLLRNGRTKHWMRLFYAVKSFWQLKRSLTDEERELWQAGKSVAGISRIEEAGEVVRRYAAAAGGSESAPLA